MNLTKRYLVVICCLLLCACSSLNQSRQQTLRDTITPEREWWDLQHYHLQMQFYPREKRLSGTNTISFKALKPGARMQIDLQEPLAINKVTFNNQELVFEREGNVYWVLFPNELIPNQEYIVEVAYGGKPREGSNPPWSGGITWGRDDLGQDFIVTACQGIGASIWWPTKEHMYDEPDRGANIDITVPDPLVAVSNGRLLGVESDEENKTNTYRWQVSNPINNYGINANIGNYVSFTETYSGLGGELNVEYWVLAHQQEVAKKQFQEVPRMLKAFEYWFGPYPFYEDGYKLVSVSYAGMEHQSSVTYGNWFQNGYRGRDVSDSEVGFKFDFIIIHESGHEWFGNNITMANDTDMWIHEGFTNYSENLFVEYWFSKEDAEKYVIGSRHNILNDKPIIGKYSAAGNSRDIYYKAGNILHTIRHIINDDEKWRSILRGLNQEFRLQTVTTKQIEDYISREAGVDLSNVFNQYLRTKDIPTLVYQIKGNTLRYRYENVIEDFDMPIRITLNNQSTTITPGYYWRELVFESPIESVEGNTNYLVHYKQR